MSIILLLSVCDKQPKLMYGNSFLFNAIVPTVIACLIRLLSQSYKIKNCLMRELDEP